MLCELRPVLSMTSFPSRRRPTRWNCDWSSDVCSSDLIAQNRLLARLNRERRRPRRHSCGLHHLLPTRTSALPVLPQRVGWRSPLISGYFHISLNRTAYKTANCFFQVKLLCNKAGYAEKCEPEAKTTIIPIMKKLALLLLLCFSPCAVSDGLPDLGDISQTVLTPLQERQIGQQSVMQI